LSDDINRYSGGPWSHAMRDKYEKALREKSGIKLRETERAHISEKK